MRLFVAVNLPEQVKAEVFQAARPLQQAAPGVSWVRPGTLHITLKFLGEVPERAVALIEAALQTVTGEAGPFDLHLRTAGAFPELRRPRVYWLGADGGHPLLRLQGRVEEELERLGFAREARRFHAHVTLGRAGRALAPDQMRQAERAALVIGYETTVSVRSIELMQSRLSPSGAHYDVLHSVRLGRAEELG